MPAVAPRWAALIGISVGVMFAPAIAGAQSGLSIPSQLTIASAPQPIAGTQEATIQSVEWNVAKVRAPEVWAKGFTGQGIVVANIDTGVQYTHPALVQRYRGNAGGSFTHAYNWWDATATCP